MAGLGRLVWIRPTILDDGTILMLQSYSLIRILSGSLRENGIVSRLDNGARRRTDLRLRGQLERHGSLPGSDFRMSSVGDVGDARQLRTKVHSKSVAFAFCPI